MEPTSATDAHAEERARQQSASDRLAWRQYACAALAGEYSQSVTAQGECAIAAGYADHMLQLERERFAEGK